MSKSHAQPLPESEPITITTDQFKATVLPILIEKYGTGQGLTRAINKYIQENNVIYYDGVSVSVEAMVIPDCDDDTPQRKQTIIDQLREAVEADGSTGNPKIEYLRGQIRLAMTASLLAKKHDSNFKQPMPCGCYHYLPFVGTAPCEWLTHKGWHTVSAKGVTISLRNIDHTFGGSDKRLAAYAASKSPKPRKLRVYFKHNDHSQVMLITKDWQNLGLYNLTQVNGKDILAGKTGHVSRSDAVAEQPNSAGANSLLDQDQSPSEASDREMMQRKRTMDDSRRFKRDPHLAGATAWLDQNDITRPSKGDTYIDDFCRASRMTRLNRDRMVIQKLVNAYKDFIVCDNISDSDLINTMHRALYFEKINRKANKYGTHILLDRDVLKDAVYLEAASHSEDDDDEQFLEPPYLAQASQTPNGTEPSPHVATPQDRKTRDQGLSLQPEKPGQLNTYHSSVPTQAASHVTRQGSGTQDSTAQYASQQQLDVETDSYDPGMCRKSFEQTSEQERDAQSAEVFSVCILPGESDQVFGPSESPCQSGEI